MTEKADLDLTQATDITMQTYKQIAGGYAERHQRHSIPPFWQANYELFVAQVQASPGWQKDKTLPILDAGCSPGRDSLIFAQQGFYVQATDLSAEMLTEARQRCLNQPGSELITFGQMDMRHLELPDASCAGAWVSASFLHIPKQENRAVLAKLTRVLVPGAPLVLLVKEADAGSDERSDPWPGNDASRFFARYHGGELWNLLEECGLGVIFLVTDRHKRAPSEQGWMAALALKAV